MPRKDTKLYRMPENTGGKPVSVGGRDLEPRGNLVEVHDELASQARAAGLTPATKDEVTRWDAQEKEMADQKTSEQENAENMAGADTPSRVPGPGTAVSPEEARKLGMQGTSTGGSVTPTHPPTQPINPDERGGVAGSPNKDTQASAAGNPPAGQQAPSGTTDRGANAATEASRGNKP